MPKADPSAQSWKRNKLYYAQKVAEDPRFYSRQHYKSKYNLSLETVDAILAEQGYCCKCCGALEPGGRGKWHLHHSHRSGKILAFLCFNCNHGSGLFEDNPMFLRKMAEINEEK